MEKKQSTKQIVLIIQRESIKLSGNINVDGHKLGRNK